MGTREPRVEAYLAKAPEFGKPILNRIRQEVHAASIAAGKSRNWKYERKSRRLFRPLDQDDMRVLARAVEHEVFPVRRNVE